jgi:hypothetical protein
MNPPEIERLVTAALQADAEDAMNRSSTTEQLESLIRATERDTRKRRRLQVATALAAAAAVAVVAVLVWPHGDTTTAPPVGPPTRTAEVTDAEQVATDFLGALAGFDRAGAATYVADGAQLRLGTVMGAGAANDPWKLRNRWDEATGWKVTDVQGCRETAVSGIDVRCLFTAHQLGSDRLGRGPFDANVLTVTVRDGRISNATLTTAHTTNGFADTMWDPFWAWMGDAHPDDEAMMTAFENPGASPARVNRSLRLWEKRTQQYVDAVRAGRAQ